MVLRLRASDEAEQVDHMYEVGSERIPVAVRLPQMVNDKESQQPAGDASGSAKQVPASAWPAAAGVVNGGEGAAAGERWHPTKPGMGP